MPYVSLVLTTIWEWPKYKPAPGFGCQRVVDTWAFASNVLSTKWQCPKYKPAPGYGCQWVVDAWAFHCGRLPLARVPAFDAGPAPGEPQSSSRLFVLHQIPTIHGRYVQAMVRRATYHDYVM